MERYFFKHRHIYCVIVIHVALFASDFRICETASVKSARHYDSNVYIVTPDSSKEDDFYPVFLPTPVPEYKPSGVLNKTKERTINTTERPSSSTSPDIIIAEFKAGSVKVKGKPNERMLSVKEMLDKEKINTPYITTEKSTTTVSNMKVQDVWDIINHNDGLEQKKTENNDSNQNVNINSRHSFGNVNAGYTIETVPSIEVQKGGWPDAVPKMEDLLKHSKTETEGDIVDDTPLESTARWSNPQSISYRRQPQRLHYYPSYTSNEDFTNIDDTQYEMQPGKGEALDRYNPSKPYLPPKQNIPTDFRPNPPPPAPLPPPPPPMPPAQPPKQLISPPPMDSYSYDPPPPPQDSPQDKPPSDSYVSYQPPEMDSGPPSYPPPDQHDHNHHHDDFKFQLPPSDGPPSSGVGSTGVDTYPSLIFDHDPHDHHHDHPPEFDYHDFYHHHHHDHPPPPPPPTTTTEAPVVEDKRVNNRYSYYYLGKKLWYLPLYFSIYFICYVGVLIVKSIARHKITYPQHWKSKRSLGNTWRMSDESLQMLTKFATDALVKSAAKYLENKFQ